METKILPTTSLTYKVVSIAICFLILSILLGLLMVFFKTTAGLNIPSSNLITAVTNLILIVASMLVIKTRTTFEYGDWIKVATWLIAADLVVVILALATAISSINTLNSSYTGAYIMPHTNQLGDLLKDSAIASIESIVTIILCAWLILRKGNSQ